MAEHMQKTDLLKKFEELGISAHTVEHEEVHAFFWSFSGLPAYVSGSYCAQVTRFYFDCERERERERWGGGGGGDPYASIFRFQEIAFVCVCVFVCVCARVCVSLVEQHYVQLRGTPILIVWPPPMMQWYI